MGELFKLFVRISADTTEYDKGLAETEKKGNSLGKALKKGIGDAVKTAAKVAVAAITAVSGALAFVAKSAVSAYGQFEQLQGGVQKLYGNMGMSVEEYANSVGKSVDEVQDEWQKLENAQNTVLKNAQLAYKNAGMSANQYLETATGFSAALINSLGGDTEKAAAQVDVAMRAISDNVNTFGTDMESVQYAFQGFAKQQYNMLDNLKLGYGGTKKEMERLIKDANEYAKANGLAADLSIDSFSDIITAIQLIQEKQHIAGTTAREAATTIEGSVNSAKAAWQNLLVAFGSGEGVQDAIKNFIESSKTVVTNVLPVFKNALAGIGQLVKEVAPIITAELPGLVSDILPGLLDAATTLVGSFVKALPGILDAIWKVLQSAIYDLQRWLNSRFPAVGQAFYIVRTKAKEAFVGIVELWNNKLKPALKQFGEFLKTTVLPIAQTVFQALGTAIGWVRDHLDQLMPIIMAIIGAIVGAKIVATIATIAGAISTVVTTIQTLIGALSMIKSFSGLVSVITTLAGGPITLIIAAIGALVAAFIYLWNTSDGFREFWINLWEKIKEIALQVADFLVNAWNAIVTTVQAVAAGIAQFVTDVVTFVTNLRENMIALWENIKAAVTEKVEALKSAVISAWENLKSSVSEKVNALKSAITDKFNAIKTAVQNKVNEIKTNVTNTWNNIKTTITNTIDNIKTSVTSKFESIKNTIESKINAARDTVKFAIDKIKGFFDFSWDLPHLKLPHVSISGNFSLFPPSAPHFDVDWYAKAMDKAYMLSGATIFGSMNGRALGGGEKGREMIMGEDYFNALLQKMVAAVSGDQIIINVYPREGQNENDIAEMVQQKLTLWERQRQAAIA